MLPYFNCPKVATTRKLRPLRAANSERNGGRYLRNCTVYKDIDSKYKVLIMLHVFYNNNVNNNNNINVNNIYNVNNINVNNNT